MSSNTVILGNGLSALIWAAYHPNSVIIGPGKPGGMAKDMKAPFFLHKHPATERLLKELGLSTCTREVKVGYAYSSTVGTYIRDEPPKGFRDSYYRHSRCLYTGCSDSVPNSVMNQGAERFEAYKITPDTLINQLIEAVISIGGVFYRDILRKIVVDREVIGVYGDRMNALYKEVISTIPINIFQSLLPEQEYKRIYQDDSLTKIFLEAKEQDPCTRGYDFVYLCPHQKHPIFHLFASHITLMNNNHVTKKTFFEYTFVAGAPIIDEAMKQLTEIYGEDRVSLHPEISVRRDVEWKKYHGIKFLGRGAQWDHSIKVQDVVMEAQKHAEQ